MFSHFIFGSHVFFQIPALLYYVDKKKLPKGRLQQVDRSFDFNETTLILMHLLLIFAVVWMINMNHHMSSGNST